MECINSLIKLLVAKLHAPYGLPIDVFTFFINNQKQEKV